VQFCVRVALTSSCLFVLIARVVYHALDVQHTDRLADRRGFPGMIHIVVEARDRRVYFYNGNGNYQRMRLRDFLRTP
jgi:hypothetical protein